MPTYECSNCGKTLVERPYDVAAVEVVCPNEDCEEFCPHVNFSHPLVRRLLDKLNLDDPSAAALVDAVPGSI